MQTNNSSNVKLLEIAARIKEMREIFGYTEEQMASLTHISVDEYKTYEAGLDDFPFSFIHRCSQVFGIEMNELLEGKSPKLQ